MLSPFHLFWHWYSLLLVLASWGLYHGAANNLAPSLPCTFKLYPWASLGQDRVPVCCCKVRWCFLNYYHWLFWFFAQDNLVCGSQEITSINPRAVSSFCLYLDMLWVLLVPKSGFQIWTGSDIQQNSFNLAPDIPTLW